MLNARKKVLDAADRRFKRTVAAEAAGTTDGWPLRVALGHMGSDELANRMPEVSQAILDLRKWTNKYGLDVEWTVRSAGGKQHIPTHVTVPNIDAAARLLGREQVSQLELLRSRARILREHFTLLDQKDAARVLRATNSWPEADFSLLVDASEWFSQHDATGLTPRQVPLAGFHAKWLNARGRQALIANLARRDDLGLIEPPGYVQFAYLDPTHLARGGRRYDIQVAGDKIELPYQPAWALVVENQDTFRFFPPLDQGICVYGCGSSGASRVTQVAWLANLETLFYWGDMDADGMQILNDYRAHGLQVISLFMNLTSYRRYEAFGTNLAAGVQALDQRAYHQLEFLTQEELELYNLLCDPSFTGNRRIEQERIPLIDAQRELAQMLRQAGANGYAVLRPE